MNAYDVIVAPLVSEKAYQGYSEGRYTFWVHKRATKTEVKEAIQKAFSVTVQDVNILNVRGKWKRVGKFMGEKADRRKAVVQLAEGQKIEALEAQG